MNSEGLNSQIVWFLLISEDVWIVYYFEINGREMLRCIVCWLRQVAPSSSPPGWGPSDTFQPSRDAMQAKHAKLCSFENWDSQYNLEMQHFLEDLATTRASIVHAHSWLLSLTHSDAWSRCQDVCLSGKVVQRFFPCLRPRVRSVPSAKLKVQVDWCQEWWTGRYHTPTCISSGEWSPWFPWWSPWFEELRFLIWYLQTLKSKTLTLRSF